MIYLNAGIIDQYDNPKVDLECAVTKAYSQDILRNLTKFAMDLIDTPVTIEGHPIELDIRNAIQLQYYETSDALKGYVGGVGLQNAKVNIFPFFYIFPFCFQNTSFSLIPRIILENGQAVTRTRFGRNSD